MSIAVNTISDVNVTTSDVYDKTFWERRASTAELSARACVPLFVELFKPSSVVDVGCGQGHWLVEFQRLGVSDVLGIDGAYVVNEGRLLIPESHFRMHDLLRPLKLDRRFSLALCLEVAEHLSQSVARQLVHDLTVSAPIVVFSAAIPGQGGIGHVNEQWPWYWEQIFGELGFVQLDMIRPSIWKNPSIATWYRQNIFVYASQEKCPALIAENRQTTDSLTLISREALENLTRPSLFMRAVRKAGRLTGLWRSPKP